MKLRGISIRARFFLLILLCLLIPGITTLFFLDASHKLDERREVQFREQSLLQDLARAETSLLSALPGMSATQQAACLRNINHLESTLAENAGSGLLKEQSTEALRRLKQRFSTGAKLQEDALLADLGVLSGLLRQLCAELSEQEADMARSISYQVGITFVFGMMLMALILGLNAWHINEGFRKLLHFTTRIRGGHIPSPIDLQAADEFGILANDLNTHSEALRKKVNYINELASDSHTGIYSPAENDELDLAMVKLSETLTRKDLDEVSRNRKDKKLNWISEGNAQIGEVLRSERENLVELCYALIRKLVAYMRVEMGALYLSAGEEKGQPVLNLTPTYAYDRRKYLDAEANWGGGLPGTCAREKKRIFISDVPEEYFEVSSGTGSARPNCLLLVPLMLGESVYGVIELATVRLLQPFEIEFVESLAESIASSLRSVQANEQTAELLKQSQTQARELTEQEAAMKESMKKLEEAQMESGKREREIEGIQTAINQSVLVAELNPNRRYLSINDNFLALLGTHRDMVLGKQHSDLAMVDPYTDEYKNFWEGLKQGNQNANVEQYRIVEGKEVWLKQSFTPILNSEGRVSRILNIATDISESRYLQEELSSREAEITRSTLDLQTLNRAVNTALIKAELDPEGIITEVNDKYTEITGFSRKEVLGRNNRLFLKSTEKEQFEKIWEQVLKGKTFEGVVRRSLPTGEEIWLASTFTPGMEDKGKITKVYMMGFDITEKKLKYQLLEDANREIERLKEALDDGEST